MKYRSEYSAKRAAKWFGIGSILIAYLVASGLTSLLPVATRRRRTMRVRTTSFFSKLALAVFAVRIQGEYRERFQSRTTGGLVVSNHLSYIDILVISSLLPSVFITSVELKNTPLLGLLARFGGSLFIERRNRSGLKQEIKDIAGVLREGFTVVLFPEGTTSNGDCVCGFRNSLFDAAVSSGACILPVCLYYSSINGEPIAPENRDNIFYYGGASFSKHFPRFLSLKSVQVVVTPVKGITPQPATNRKDLAALTHTAISTAYNAQMRNKTARLP